MLSLATGHYAGKVAEVGLHVQRYPVEGHPFAQLDANGSDLVFLLRQARRLTLNPDPDTAVANLTVYVEPKKSGYDPGFQGGDKLAYVAIPGCQVEHDIGNPLPWAVIGILTAPPRLENWKTIWLQKIGRFC